MLKQAPTALLKPFTAILKCEILFGSTEAK